MAHSAIERADRAAAASVAPAHRNPAVALLGRASEIADQPPLIALSCLALAGGLVAGKARLAETGGRMLAAELAATALKSVIKRRIDRTRPEVERNGGDYRAEPGDSDQHDLNSFPSGHTAGAIAVARAIGRTYPAARWPMLALAAGIGAIQVPRGKHYPTDLAAGAIIGLAAEALVAGTVAWAKRRLDLGTTAPPSHA